MKIGVDLRCLSQAPLGGIARATKELWETWQDGSRSPEPVDRNLIGFFEGNAVALRKAILASGVDRLFCPTGAVPPFCPVPAIPWIHDLAIFDHPEWFPQNVLRRKLTTSLVLRGIQRAPRVFAVSQDTKEAMVRIAGVEADKVAVTYQGVFSSLRGGGAPTKQSLREQGEIATLVGRARNDGGWRYALILGTVEPRKQPSWVAGWWEELRAMGYGLDLVVAGPAGWGGEEQRLQNVAGQAPWFHRMSVVDDGLKTNLIKNAACVLVPSLHEGFGRVALEAMVLGTPVIASNRGALPEVVGDGGCLLDPTDPQGWIRTVGGLVSSEGIRQRMVEAGYRQAQRFSWPKIAQGMLASLLAF